MQEELESWVFVSSDWWRCSYTDVEWACVRRYHWTETGVKLTIHPQPPYYHDALYNNKEQFGQDVSQTQDLALNRSLVGVKAAEDALGAYERNVGICDPFQTELDFMFSAQLFLPEDATEDVLRRGREEWVRLVEELLGGILEPSCFDLPVYSPEVDGQFWRLDTMDHSYDSDVPDMVDLTDSDISGESDPLPTTPPGDKKSYAEVLFDDRAAPTHTGTVVSPSPSKPLNASALSFIPSFFLDHHSPSPAADEPYVSPTYEYHFPSLSGNAASRSNTRSLPPSLERDEHGFYNEVPPVSTQSAMQSRSATPKRPSGAEVPSYLGSAPRHGSKTREMVDRLRSNSSGGSRRNRKNKGEGSSLRSSVDASAPQMGKDSEGWIVDVGAENGHKRAKSSKSGGWVEGLFQCRSQEKPEQPQRKHKRSKSSTTNASAPSTNHPTPPTPSSISSTVSTLPSPTSSTFSDPRTPTNTQFPLSTFYVNAFPSPYAAYPGTYPMPPQGPPMQIMQAPWQISTVVPAHPAYGLPPMYGPIASPYETHKAAAVGTARLA